MSSNDTGSDAPCAEGRDPHPTPQLAAVVALVADILDTDLVGAYLHGSSVLGGLRRYSDLDLLAVAQRPTTRAEKRRLVERLLTISSVERFHTAARHVPSDMPRPIELTLVVQSEVRPWRYPPRFDFQYGDWLRPAFARGEIEPWPTTIAPDLTSLLTMVLLADRPLLGPPPAAVLDPVPYADYVRAIVGDIDALRDNLQGDTTNVLLTLARIWSTLATDGIRPKDGAATWVLAHLPPEQQPVLARARAIYLGAEDAHWDDLRHLLRPCTDALVRTIQRLAATGVWQDPSRAVRLLS